mmetsp:Transcript_70163/g.139138  ORF Transcript_70163/g.139138 Transcript_70163/m.139138 type:complete len:93 (+) Transcript_70163:106-384(+)
MPAQKVGILPSASASTSNSIEVGAETTQVAAVSEAVAEREMASALLSQTQGLLDSAQAGEMWQLAALLRRQLQEQQELVALLHKQLLRNEPA